MLEQMRRNSRSLIIWVLFGIIIAAFIITFGPQSGHDSAGCGTQSDVVGEVDGSEISIHSWRFAINGIGGAGSGAKAQTRRHAAMDMLIRRELLAQVALRRGFRVSDDYVQNAIAAGEFYILGRDGELTMTGGGYGYTRYADQYMRDGVMEYKVLERYSSALGLPSLDLLLEEQRREHLANLGRRMLEGDAYVSTEEARDLYVQRNTKVKADFVKFEVAAYRAALRLDDAALGAYAAGHEAEIAARWEQEKAQLASDKSRVAARMIKVARDAPPAVDDAPGGPGTPAGTQDDAGQPSGDVTPGARPGAKPGATRRPAAGAAAVGAPRAAPSGKTGAAGAGDKGREASRTTIDAARQRLARGEDFAKVAHDVSEDDKTRQLGGRLGWKPADSLGFGAKVVEATKALAIGQVSDVIETDDAYYLVRVDQRSEKALTLDDCRLDLAGALALDDFARQLARADADKALTAARSKPLDELFKREADHDLGTEQGWIVREGPNRLAEQVAAPPAGGAGAAPTAAPPTGPLPLVVVPPPPLKSIGPVSRSGDYLANLGKSKALVSALFDQLAAGELAEQVFETTSPDGFAVVRLVERQDADVAKFEEERRDLQEQEARQRGGAVLARWIEDKCRAVAKAGGISIDQKIMAEGESEAARFQPCASLTARRPAPMEIE